VASCDACKAELELLNAARRVMSRDVPAIDVARIVAALPKPPAGAEAKPALVASSAPARAGIAKSGGGQGGQSALAPSRRIASYTSRWTAWRIAAIAMVTVGGLTVAVIRHLGSVQMVGPATDSTIAQPVPQSQQPVAPQATPTPSRPSGVVPGPTQPSVTHPQNATQGSGAEEAAGLAVASDISELSDGDVQSLLQDMNGFDDQLPADPDAAVPALPAEPTP
jgi:hypothetical protein